METDHSKTIQDIRERRHITLLWPPGEKKRGVAVFPKGTTDDQIKTGDIHALIGGSVDEKGRYHPPGHNRLSQEEISIIEEDVQQILRKK